jgi:hypothetical protein
MDAGQGLISIRPILAYAQKVDLSGSDWKFVVLCLAAVTGAAVLSLAAVAVVRSRRPGWLHAALMASFVWGVLAAGSVIAWLVQQSHWASEQALLLKTGYYDPAEATPAPEPPWPLWIAIALAYVVAIGWLVLSPSGHTDHR